MTGDKIRKIFRIISLVMTVVAIVFLIYAFGHPEGSWIGVPLQTVRMLYGLYIVIDIGLFVASFFIKKAQQKNQKRKT
jgi:uncharacterized membrane protein